MVSTEDLTYEVTQRVFYRGIVEYYVKTVHKNGLYTILSKDGTKTKTVRNRFISPYYKPGDRVMIINTPNSKHFPSSVGDILTVESADGCFLTVTEFSGRWYQYRFRWVCAAQKKVRESVKEKKTPDNVTEHTKMLQKDLDGMKAPAVLFPKPKAPPAKEIEVVYLTLPAPDAESSAIPVYNFLKHL